MKLSDFQALTFDCYGTLIDWETGILQAIASLARRAKREPTPHEILETHARYESMQQRFTPSMRYSEVLSVVYRRIAESWGVPVSLAECETYGRSIGQWPAFPDTVEALRYLGKHYRLAILSNVDRTSFQFSQALLQTEFAAIYTAEDIGSYKPDPRNFDYMLAGIEGLGIGKAKILHTAESLFHDHNPASQIGLATCWIERRHGKDGFGATMDPGERPATDFHFTSLGALADAHRQEAAQQAL